MNAPLLREGPAPPAVEGPGLRSGRVVVRLPAARLFAAAAAVVGHDGVVAVSAEELVLEPFSAAAEALKRWHKAFASKNPRRVRTRWTTW